MATYNVFILILYMSATYLLHSKGIDQLNLLTGLFKTVLKKSHDITLPYFNNKGHSDQNYNLSVAISRPAPNIIMVIFNKDFSFKIYITKWLKCLMRTCR